MADPPLPPLPTRGTKQRYVGDRTNASKLVMGYSSESTAMRLVDNGAYRESILAVLTNLSPPIEIGVDPADQRVHGFIFRTRFYQFDCHCNPRGTVQNAHFMLAIAQFVVLSFNQLSVDLNDVNEVDKNAVMSVCDVALHCADILTHEPRRDLNAIRGGRFEFGRPIDAAALVEITEVLDSLCKPQISVTIAPDNDQNILIRHAGSMTSFNIDMREIEDYTDRAVYNANIAAAVLSAKKGTREGIIQLRNLPMILESYINERRGVIIPRVDTGLHDEREPHGGPYQRNSTMISSLRPSPQQFEMNGREEEEETPPEQSSLNNTPILPISIHKETQGTRQGMVIVNARIKP